MKPTERNLAVIVHSLFSAWMLAFLFEGQIFVRLMQLYALPPHALVYGAMVAQFAGLCCCGLFIQSKQAAKRLFLISYLVFIITSILFFFPPSYFWTISITVSAFLSGCCVAAWGFYLKSSALKHERIKPIADLFIISNVLMIALNTVATYTTPQLGLALATLLLLAAILVARKLPEDDTSFPQVELKTHDSPISMPRLMAFLYLFITIITINSGLMYGVTSPAFVHLEWLTSWYWAIPYIAAVLIMRNLPRHLNRTYILYTAIAMIGLSFVAYVVVQPTVPGYILVDTLMLGAFGIFDLFWWSIFAEMLDLCKNPAKLLGVGLSANILGVLSGGIIGSYFISAELQSMHTSLLALSVVCVTLALLPPLHKHLSLLLQDHIFLTDHSAVIEETSNELEQTSVRFPSLSKRESEVAACLLQGKTYRMIASELFVSENTIKYFVKNIYSKYGVQSRGQFIEAVDAQEQDCRTS